MGDTLEDTRLLPVLPQQPLRSTKVATPLHAATLMPLPNLGGDTVHPGTSGEGKASADKDPAERGSLRQLLATITQLLQGAVGGADFCTRGVRALVELLELDQVQVLLRYDQGWHMVSQAALKGCTTQACDPEWPERIAKEARALQAGDGHGGLLYGAPVLSADATVIAVVCGRRQVSTRVSRYEPWTLPLFETIAAVIAVGLARQEQAIAAAELRLQFEQFFSTNLAGALQRNPRLLEGEQREVTILFCDLRGYSRLAERLGPQVSCKLVADVMEHITRCVRHYEGAIVDYYGDGLLAMWNAPVDQPEHHLLACRAALAMQEQLPSVSNLWNDVLGEPLQLGIAVNTGPALVGNTGSRYRCKYGPVGHTVNLAQRLQSAARYFGQPILVSASTQAGLLSQFATRKLGRLRVPGMERAVEVFQLHAVTATPAWLQQRDTYERALAAFEAQEWQTACRTLYPLLLEMAERDRPTLQLLSRAVQYLQEPPAHFDPVIDLPAH